MLEKRCKTCQIKFDQKVLLSGRCPTCLPLFRQRQANSFAAAQRQREVPEPQFELPNLWDDAKTSLRNGFGLVGDCPFTEDQLTLLDIMIDQIKEAVGQ